MNMPPPQKKKKKKTVTDPLIEVIAERKVTPVRNTQ